jgi:signal transduction histidine kinase
MDNTAGNNTAGKPHARRRRRVPWSPHAWGQALFLAAGVPVQAVIPLALFGLITWDHTIHSQQKSVESALLWLVFVALLFLLSPVLTRVHRHRLRTTAGVEIPAQRKRRLHEPQDLVAAVRSASTWRQLGYHVLAAPALAGAAIAAIGLWLAGLAFGLVYCYGWGLGEGSFFRRATYPAGDPALPFPTGGLVVNPGGVPTGVYLTAAGIAVLLAVPRFTGAVRSLDLRLARALLGPSRADELEHRVEHLTQTRAGVVDAADAERRRLERDLHDGTQQRLVSLAINLGMARAQAGTAEEARQAIAEAHEEAKAALAELRDLIRGLHPAVLEDRGLDAALSGVTARMPIPVRLDVDLPRRPAPVIEAVAYFVVSEGLANIAKHSQATEAAVFVQRSGDRLHVIVTDDGVGGADPERGTGLAGLARRAASVDGTFDIDSPPGGPTLLTVDLPCNR